jgi:DNA-binding transcriptional MerR regulator
MSLSMAAVSISDSNLEGAPPEATESDLTIDELALNCRTTTRNIRALQSFGILLRPELVGRTAHYGVEHLVRLQAVLRLQQAGFSLASIKALLDALSAGLSLAEVLGVAPLEPNRPKLRLLSDLPSNILELPV